MKTYKHRKRKNYVQGEYTPMLKEKYIGSYPIIYRSSYELKFMRWCDRNPRILKWGSESVVIPYLNPVDGKVHRYFVDNNIVYQTKDKKIKYLVEIKPSKFTKPPKKTKRKRPESLIIEQMTYARNMAKWNAAEQWCKKKGYKFIVITEKELN